MSLKILHLSDLHIGEGKKFYGDLDELAAQILLAETGAPDTILVTGDIFDGKSFREEGYPQLIEDATHFFETLIQGLNEGYPDATPLTKGDVFFTPGNHELLQQAAERGENPFGRYVTFLETFYGGTLPEEYFQRTVGTAYCSFIKVFQEKKAILAGFCSPSYGKNDSGELTYFGDISASQLVDFSKKMNGVENREEFQLVIGLHHHFYLIEERDKSYVDKSVLRSSELLIGELAKWNVCAILHGHKHDTLNRRININLDLSGGADQMTTVLGCGATGKSKELYTNGMNLVEVYPLGATFDLAYTEFSYTRSKFERINSVQLPLARRQRASTKLGEEMKRYPDLELQYQHLRDRDTVTKLELHHMMDRVLCNVPAIARTIEEQPNVLYYLLAGMHYRSNWRNARRNMPHFTADILAFLSNVPGDERLDTGRIRGLLEVAAPDRLLAAYNDCKLNCTNEKQRRNLCFLALSMMLTEFYLIIKYEGEAFYRQIIDRKANFKFEEGEIAAGIIGNTVEFESNDDRRSMGIAVKCTNAIAHKACTLIIKEFELILLGFEHDFSSYGFKIYYLYPEILKQSGGNALNLESHNFSAYIPTLLPLLAGRSIYSQPETFARELIQNALDAINTRLEVDQDFTPLIEIRLGEERGQQYFEISDNGSGMDEYILERYLTTAGRSFYVSDDYKLSYQPISQFGIGFLSCFMLGKHIVVDTMHRDSGRAHHLDIPNFDGCFFIEEGLRQGPGTTVRVYENPDLEREGLCFDPAEIEKYIRKNILDICHPISLNGIPIEAFAYRRELAQKNENGVFFHIPLHWEEGRLTVDERPEQPLYGLYFYNNPALFWKEEKVEVLNCGLRIGSLLNRSEINQAIKAPRHLQCVMNLPASTLELDVSRDILKNIKNVDWEAVNASLEKRCAQYSQGGEYKNLPYLFASFLDKKAAPLGALCLRSGKSPCRMVFTIGGADNHHLVEIVLGILRAFHLDVDGEEEGPLKGYLDKYLLRCLEEPGLGRRRLDFLAEEMSRSAGQPLAQTTLWNIGADTSAGRAMNIAIDEAREMARAAEQKIEMYLEGAEDREGVWALRGALANNRNIRRDSHLGWAVDSGIAAAGAMTRLVAKSWGRTADKTKLINGLVLDRILHGIIYRGGTSSPNIFFIASRVANELLTLPIKLSGMFTVTELKVGIPIDPLEIETLDRAAQEV